MENTIMFGDMIVVTSVDKYERNDIAVFDSYQDDYTAPLEEPGKYKKKWQTFIHRIVAYSGDSVEIREGELYVNGKKILAPGLSKTDYDINYQPGAYPWLNEQEFENAYVTGTNIIRVTLTSQKADELRKKPAIISIKKVLLPVNTADTFFARPSRDLHWSPDQYGPLRIPVPGETIIVDADNYKLYENIPGLPATGKFTIREKLYFVLGDNRHAALDSRYIGFISHSRIKGIVKKE
jgi:signal peptidase I